MMFSMMVAMADQRVIGYQNTLPWHLPADMTFFKRNTMAKAILMGRKTYDSIGRPLPGRDNIILSRQQDLQVKGCQVIHTLEQAAQYEGEELICIGGARLYQQCLPLVQRIYLTEIAGSFAGDAFFPELPDHQWHRVVHEAHAADEKNHWDYSFSTWERV
ncbi:MAG: dihydrofolate reductase [Mariprofundaceae bacterium]|nr:dihydrofolate reductase [Mariprofundaceae bacterium]